jgi:hypothetical protein
MTMKEWFVLCIGFLLILSTPAFADALDCSTRGQWSDGPHIPRCWEATENKPESKYTAITGAIIGGSAGVALATAFGNGFPVVAATGALSAAAFYWYVDSFEGPTYEANERRYKKYVDETALQIRKDAESTISNIRSRIKDAL